MNAFHFEPLHGISYTDGSSNHHSVSPSAVSWLPLPFVPAPVKTMSYSIINQYLEQANHKISGQYNCILLYESISC